MGFSYERGVGEMLESFGHRSESMVSAVFNCQSFVVWAYKTGRVPATLGPDPNLFQQFASFDEEAQRLIEGGETAKTRPGENSRWFAQIAADINAQVAAAGQRIGSHRSREFDSTITDLKILANLALFHSRRIPAAVSYRLFERTKDTRALDDAIAAEHRVGQRARV